MKKARIPSFNKIQRRLSEGKRKPNHGFLKGFISSLFIIYITIIPSSYTHWSNNNQIVPELEAEISRLNAEEDSLIARLQAEVDRLTVFETQVVATMYKPSSYYTDSTPDVLADGTRINIHKVEHLRYVALSRNLLKRWGGPFEYGDFIVVEGADDHRGNHNGIWQVKDTMNKRWVDRIDFLVPLGTKNFKYDVVTIKRQSPKRLASL